MITARTVSSTLTSSHIQDTDSEALRLCPYRARGIWLFLCYLHIAPTGQVWSC